MAGPADHVELVLHLGGHRTGSTAVDENLRANAAALALEGTVIWHPDRVRKTPGLAALAPLPGDPAQRAELAARLADTGARQVLISDENLLGSMGRNLREGRFYDQAPENLARLAAVLPRAPHRIGLGIRDYKGYWLSAYAYQILRKPLPPFENLARSYAAQPRGWIDLVQDMRAMFPETEILIWPMETLRGRVIDVGARLIGRPDRGALRPMRKTINASLGADSIPVICGLRETRADWTETELIAAFEAAGGAPAPYQPFTAPELAHMDMRYREELAAFRDGFAGVRLLERSEVGA